MSEAWYGNYSNNSYMNSASDYFNSSRNISNYDKHAIRFQRVFIPFTALGNFTFRVIILSFRTL
jgi:hypothetical protein